MRFFKRGPIFYDIDYIYDISLTLFGIDTVRNDAEHNTGNLDVQMLMTANNA